MKTQGHKINFTKEIADNEIAGNELLCVAQETSKCLRAVSSTLNDISDTLRNIWGVVSKAGTSVAGVRVRRGVPGVRVWGGGHL